MSQLAAIKKLCNCGFYNGSTAVGTSPFKGSKFPMNFAVDVQIGNFPSRKSRPNRIWIIKIVYQLFTTRRVLFLNTSPGFLSRSAGVQWNFDYAFVSHPTTNTRSVLR